MKWVFVGSGPSAPGQVNAILPRLRPCKTITTNAGLKVLPNPDIYFVADRVACKRYIHLAREAKAMGTHMVTMHRYPHALKERGVEWFDEFVLNGLDPPLPNRWGAFNQSGPFSMEYACRNGAGELHLLGCEGYTDTAAYFDQDERGEEHTEPALRHKISDSLTTQHLIKRMAMVVGCFADVPFFVYGTPHYALDFPNWHVCEN